MATSSQPPGAFRFGAFEVDLGAGELRRRGLKLKLQDQPFRVLALLLQRAGETVTREELREKLWHADTFVEFDQGLNTAINKLRDVLGDSADSPRFVETVPRRGYRFVAPVQVVTDNGGPAGAEPRFVGLAGEWTGRRVTVATLAAVGLLTAGLLAGFWAGSRHRTSPGPGPLVRITYSPDMSMWPEPVLSPDGRRVAYVNRAGKLEVQDLDRAQPRQIEGTENAGFPFWSPDSNSIGFCAGGELKKVEIHGGPPVLLCRLPRPSILGGAWSPDGNSIVFAAWPEGIFEVHSRGGTPARIIEHPRAWDPSFVPGRGRTLLYIAKRAGFAELIVHSLDTGKQAVLAKAVRLHKPSYSPTGHILYGFGSLYGYGGSFWALPFSLQNLQATSDPFPIASPGDLLSAGNNGALAYLDSGLLRRQLIWRSRDGERLGAIPLRWPVAHLPRLSPDGRRVAVIVGKDDQWDVAVVELSSGLVTRLTSDLAEKSRPTWSPNGDRVVFASVYGDRAAVLAKTAGGGEGAEVLLEGMNVSSVEDWSRDGRHILVVEEAGRSRDVWNLTRKGDGGYERLPFLKNPVADELGPVFSPDGLHVAYESNESGQPEVYVRRFPTGGGPWQVSTQGGRLPRWRGDGRELFFVEGDSVIAVEVATAPAFSIGERKRLFDCRLCFAVFGHQYDVSADGRRFILSEPPEHPPRPVIRVVLNWFGEFRDRKTRPN